MDVGTPSSVPPPDNRLISYTLGQLERENFSLRALLQARDRELQKKDEFVLHFLFGLSQDARLEGLVQAIKQCRDETNNLRAKNEVLDQQVAVLREDVRKLAGNTEKSVAFWRGRANERKSRVDELEVKVSELEAQATECQLNFYHWEAKVTRLKDQIREYEQVVFWKGGLLTLDEVEDRVTELTAMLASLAPTQGESSSTFRRNKAILENVLAMYEDVKKRPQYFRRDMRVSTSQALPPPEAPAPRRGRERKSCIPAQTLI